MDNREIKLRLVEAFIAQKTPIEIITSDVKKLVDYINAEESRNTEQSNYSEEEKLRKIYFDFYDKMDEPERSEAKKNWSYDYFSYHTKNLNLINTIHGAISFGFDWGNKSEYWNEICKKYS